MALPASGWWHRRSRRGPGAAGRKGPPVGRGRRGWEQSRHHGGPTPAAARQDLYKTAIEFLKLEKIELGGVRGSILGSLVAQIHEEVFELVKVFVDCKYDPLDPGDSVGGPGGAGRGPRSGKRPAGGAEGPPPPDSAAVRGSQQRAGSAEGSPRVGPAGPAGVLGCAPPASHAD